MIHIKCKICGRHLPFSKERNKDAVKSQGDSDIICLNYGQMLIKSCGKWK